MSFRRRISPGAPRLVGRTPNDYAQELQEFLEHGQKAAEGGLPAGFGRVVPVPVAVGGSGSAGNETTGWMAADARLVLGTGTPVPIGMTNAEGSSSAAPRLDHVHATPLTTNGDVLTVAAGALARVAIGAAGKVLTVVAGAPAWAVAPGAASFDPVTDPFLLVLT